MAKNINIYKEIVVANAANINNEIHIMHIVYINREFSQSFLSMYVMCIILTKPGWIYKSFFLKIKYQVLTYDVKLTHGAREQLKSPQVKWLKVFFVFN